MSAKVEYINTKPWPWSNLFKVSPPKFNVKCQLQKEEFLQISIISNCNDCIAWKIKTNRQGRYVVSPRQGIIQPKKHKDCTIVLSKLKRIPDTKKPDKFLIQATKIHSQTQRSDLPQLWKDRELKHDKKRGVYAYQSITIKCFLNFDIKSSKSEEKKQNDEHVLEIDNVSAVDTDKSKQNPINSVVFNSITEIKTEPQQTATINKPTYNLNKVDEWRKKALKDDELFQFTRKLLAERDQLNVQWKSEQEKTRIYMKLNRELKEKNNKYAKDNNVNSDNINCNQCDILKRKLKLNEIEKNSLQTLVNELLNSQTHFKNNNNELQTDKTQYLEQCNQLKADKVNLMEQLRMSGQ